MFLLPGDVRYGNVEEAAAEYPTKYRTVTRPYGEPALMGAAVRRLLEAEWPLILAANGARFNLILSFGKPPRFNPAAKALMVRVDATEISHSRPIDLGIVGDDYSGDLLC